jgi:hypothetical protein
MDDAVVMVANSWQDWVTVLGFVGFTTFIIWRVYMTTQN